MEETDPSNEAIQRYLDFCRDQDPSEREVEIFLLNNPFKGDIQRFIDTCRVTRQKYGSDRCRCRVATAPFNRDEYTWADGFDEKDWNVLMFIFKQLGFDLHRMREGISRSTLQNPNESMHIMGPTSSNGNYLAINDEPIQLPRLGRADRYTLISYGIDEHKRIFRLDISSYLFATNELRCIGHLDHLRWFRFQANAKSPNEIYFPLNDLSKELRSLFIKGVRYSDGFRHLVTSAESPHLTHLYCQLEVLPIMHRCESLEELHLMLGNRESAGENEIDEVIEGLLARDLPFTKKLRTIDITVNSMTTDQFERILFEVVPRFPNLENLSIRSSLNANSYIKAAVDRIQSNSSIRISKSLRKLKFSTERESSLTKEEICLAVNTFLKTFVTIDHISVNFDRIPQEFKYPLVINMAGRRLFAVANRQNLGLWPFLLQAAQKDLRIERAFAKRDFTPVWEWKLQDGIFGLLREYPDLIFDSKSAPIDEGEHGRERIESSKKRKATNDFRR